MSTIRAIISAVPVHIGDKNHPGPTFTQFKVIGLSASMDSVILTPELAAEREVDEAVEHLIKEIEKAGKEAKKLLLKSKGGA